MKKFLAILMGALLLMGCVSAAADTKITATGVGVVTATPDMATINVGVNETDKDVQAAQGRVNERIDAIREALKTAGVDAGDITLGDIYMYTQYDYESGSEAVTGYRVSHTLSVVVREVNNVGAIIDVALGAGANELNGVTFGLMDDSALYQQALALAVANARTRALAMAQAEGLALGKIDSMTEGDGNWYGEYRSVSASDAGGMGDGTSVDVGSTKITANVTVVYELDD